MKNLDIEIDWDLFMSLSLGLIDDKQIFLHTNEFWKDKLCSSSELRKYNNFDTVTLKCAGKSHLKPLRFKLVSIGVGTIDNPKLFEDVFPEMFVINLGCKI